MIAVVGYARDGLLLDSVKTMSKKWDFGPLELVAHRTGLRMGGGATFGSWVLKKVATRR